MIFTSKKACSTFNESSIHEMLRWKTQGTHFDCLDVQSVVGTDFKSSRNTFIMKKLRERFYYLILDGRTKI